jgi:AcrR family transcriptional regulator
VSPQSTREHLIEQALIFFASNDYERSSLNDIANELGVTKGAIYHYFDGKDGLFEAAVLRLVHTIEGWLLDGIEETNSFGDYLRGLFEVDEMIEDIKAEAGLEATLADYENVIYMVMAGIKKFPHLKELMKGLYNRFQKQLVRMMHAGVVAGEIRSDLDFEAIAFEITAFYEGSMFLGVMSMQRDYIDLGPRVCEGILARMAVVDGKEAVR